MYDFPMILSAISGVSNMSLKKLSDQIISKEVNTYKLFCDQNLWYPKNIYNHIDIMNVIAGKAGLKTYGARIHTKLLQDLPIDPSKTLTEKEKSLIKRYCANDVRITRDLFYYLKGELTIREDINSDYGVEVRSQSDAQIAETLIKKQLDFKVETNKGYVFKYKLPQTIRQEKYSIVLQGLIDKIVNLEFKVKLGEKPTLGGEKAVKISVGKGTYKFGVGGLHSTEKAQCVIADKDEILLDIDVSSYYPSIILNNGFYPKAFDKEEFLKFYKNIYHKRLEAKLSSDSHSLKVASTFKIILNGLYGKLGDQYSVLYSPKMLINTTLTGQLNLLCLIDILEKNNIRVYSANTDGIVVKLKKVREGKLNYIVSCWEKNFNFKTDRVYYSAVYSQSVNSYMAFKTEGGVKFKGLLSYNDISSNPVMNVCKDAIIGYLRDNIPVEKTIRSCADMTKFITIRKVTSGGYWNNEYLGKVVRWYWSTEGQSILNLKGDRVSNTEGAYPIMNLEVKPVNIDYDRYIKYTFKLLKEMGVTI